MNDIIIANEKNATLKTIENRNKRQIKAFLESIQDTETYGYILTPFGKVAFSDYLRLELKSGSCADRLAKAMSDKGYDNQRLAEATELDPSCIWRLLNGKRKASYDTVRKIETVLGDIF